MALQTSQTWKDLFEKRGTTREYKFEINGVTYGDDAEISHSVERELFNEFGFGNASTAHLTLTLIADNIPRAATIKRFVRLVNDGEVSEWLPAGVFFTNRRTEDDGVWTIEAFDVMRKAEQSWNPLQSLNFPLSMKTAVEEFARIMGCEIDPRTTINAAYTVDYPTSDPENKDPVNNNYSLRQELQWIAAAHGANWIVTSEGKLLLVPLGGEPSETHYLVDEHGSAITFGGDRILV